MELKVKYEGDGAEVFVVPSHEDGSLLVELDQDVLVDLIGLSQLPRSPMGMTIAVEEIKLLGVDKSEIPSIRNGNEYVKRQLVRAYSDLGEYALRGEISINLNGKRKPISIYVSSFQEVAPSPTDS